MTVTLYPCGRGHRCDQAVYDPATGQKHPPRSERPFCEPCTEHVRAALRDLPTVYRELRAQYGIHPVIAADDVRVDTSRVNPTIPVREDLDALLVEIADTVGAYEDRVRQTLGMGPAPRVSWQRLPARVEAACTLLAGRVEALIGLPMEWMRIGGSHDERGGLDAGLDVMDLHRRTARAGGKQQVRYVVQVVCPECRFPAGVTRVAGEDGASCLGCGFVLSEDAYRALVGDTADAVQPV